jgi:cysteine desulfurase
MARPDPYYFDYSASEPPYEEALEEFVQTAVEYSANPSSSHSSGKEAQRKLIEKKIRFCNLNGLSEGHLLVCSSATEANNTIIEGHRQSFPSGKICVAEDVHDSLWYAKEKHKEHVYVLPLKGMDDLSSGDLDGIIQPGTTLVCMNHVCNETGRIHHLGQIARYCSINHIRLLIDGSQAMGHIPLRLDEVPCDYYCFSAHKFGGPRGVGGILLRDRQFEPLLSGGKQEWELRAGTENLPGLASTLKALEISLSKLEVQSERLRELKKDLFEQLISEEPRILTNTPDDSRPGFLSVSLPGTRGNEIVAALSISGFKLATGSACHADRTKPSRIILATGRSEKEALGSVRITMGRSNTAATVRELGRAMLDIIRK